MSFTITSSMPTVRSLSKRRKSDLVWEINTVQWQLKIPEAERVKGTADMTAYELAVMLHPLMLELGRRGQEAFDAKMRPALMSVAAKHFNGGEAWPADSTVDAFLADLRKAGFELREIGW